MTNAIWLLVSGTHTHRHMHRDTRTQRARRPGAAACHTHTHTLTHDDLLPPQLPSLLGFLAGDGILDMLAERRDNCDQVRVRVWF